MAPCLGRQCWGKGYTEVSERYFVGSTGPCSVDGARMHVSSSTGMVQRYVADFL